MSGLLQHLRTETDALKLRYYIPFSAPPTRAPYQGDEPFLRPEAGFSPSWFRRHCQIDFSERWHSDPEYRLESYEKMRNEIRRRFPGRSIGGALDEGPPDLVTGIYGGSVVAAMYGQPIRYFSDKWPASEGIPLSDEESDSLEPVNPENNIFFLGILRQLDRIEALTGAIKGFLNWQGVLNTSFRLRGQQIFIDLIENAGRAHHIFECVARTMIAGIKSLHVRQKRAGQDYRFATIGNCVVNMISGKHYEEHLLPFDLMIRREFEAFGIHNCAWTVDPYMDSYASVPRLGYIDMGIKSDLARARRLFPDARRNVLYTSMDLAARSDEQLRNDFSFIAEQLGPCDLGLPDIELDVSDERVKFAMDLCEELSSRHQEGTD